MTGWENDEQLLADLGSAARARADVPDWFVRSGREMFAWRGADAELAALTGDSAADGLAVTVRGQQPPRVLSFSAEAAGLELEISPDALRGQVVPAQRAFVTVDDGTDPPAGVRCDAEGWFGLSPTPLGRFRLTVRGDGFLIRTDWIAGSGDEPPPSTG